MFFLRILTILAAAFFSFSPSLAALEEDEPHWLVNDRAARRMAKMEKKPMLILFTSSDSLAGNTAFAKTLLRSRAFVREASKKYVLLFVDFPVNTRLNSEQLYRNNRMKNHFGVALFPTIVVTENSGWGVVWRKSGFPPGMTAGILLEEIAAALEKKSRPPVFSGDKN